MVKSLFSIMKPLQLRLLDELGYVLIFLLLTVFNKNELLTDWSSSPSSYVGWQAFFSFIISACLLIHPRIRNQVKMLTRTDFVSLLPACISYSLSALTGTLALSNLSIPVFLALSNLFPASLVLFGKRSNNLKSPVILGAMAVSLSVILICAIDGTEENRLFYFCMTAYSVINLSNTIYLKKIKLQVPDYTFVFFSNLLNFIILFPISMFNAIQSNPEFSQIGPCVVGGFLNLLMQMSTSRVKAKSKRFLIICGLAQMNAILLGLYLFGSDINIWLWIVILTNWFITGFVLNINEDTDNNNKFMIVVPRMRKNIYVEKFINYNMA